MSKKVLPGKLMLESGGGILVALFSLPPSPFHGVLALKALSLFEVEAVRTRRGMSGSCIGVALSIPLIYLPYSFVLVMNTCPYIWMWPLVDRAPFKVYPHLFRLLSDTFLDWWKMTCLL